MKNFREEEHRFFIPFAVIDEEIVDFWLSEERAKKEN